MKKYSKAGISTAWEMLVRLWWRETLWKKFLNKKKYKHAILERANEPSSWIHGAWRKLKVRYIFYIIFWKIIQSRLFVIDWKNHCNIPMLEMPFNWYCTHFTCILTYKFWTGSIVFKSGGSASFKKSWNL